MHSSTRSIIERAFARLKGKFCRLKGLDVSCIQYAPVIIDACCVLHNAILEHDGFDNDVEAELDDDNNYVSQTSVMETYQTTSHSVMAKDKRDNIANVL
jgi:DDE superfamily endonuclease